MGGAEFVCAQAKEEESKIDISRIQKRATRASMVDSSYLRRFIGPENLTAKFAKAGAKVRKVRGHFTDEDIPLRCLASLCALCG